MRLSYFILLKQQAFPLFKKSQFPSKEQNTNSRSLSVLSCNSQDTIKHIPLRASVWPKALENLIILFSNTFALQY